MLVPRLSRLLAALLVTSALAVSVSIQGQAGTLSMTGTLSIEFGRLPPVSVESNGSALIAVSSGSGSFVEPAGVFGPTSASVPSSLLTGVSLISGLTLSNFGNGTKTVSCGSSTCVGTGAVTGTAFINIMQLFDLAIPLSVVGQAGASVVAVDGAVVITVVGQGWTAGVASVTGVTVATPDGAVVNTVARSGSDNRTASHAGTITLVSGFKVLPNVVGQFPGFAIQSLTFVPEPRMPLLLGSVAVGIALCARRRMRKKSRSRRYGAP